MANELTHMDESGSARMVDVSPKEATVRRAKAEGRVCMQPSTISAIRGANLPKGDVLSTARLAGIMAAKQTANLIPLCHAIALDHVDIWFHFNDAGITVTSEARTTGKTGVEMEALTAVTVATLTIYDMAKAIDRGMAIEGVRLLEKEGGKSGAWSAGGK